MKNFSAKIEMLAPTALQPWKNNPRTHSKKQIRQLAKSIKAFGFTNPVLIDDHNTILAGHGRVAAAQLLNMEQVPCIRLGNMTPSEKRAYVIADNQLALTANWDEQLLAEEIKALSEIDPDFDIDLTGFSIGEIDALVDGLKPEEAGDPALDRLPKLTVATACRPGDLWALGPHRLICGNTLDPAVVAALMNGEHASMVFTDPAYNVPIQGHVGGSGAIRHPEFAMASCEMTKAEYIAFLRTTFANLVAHTIDGSIHFVCIDWRHVGEVTAASEGVYAELKNLIVWAKDNGGMGTFYRSRHELIFAFKNGTAPHTNSFELGQHGRYRTNVWEYKGVNTRKAGRLDELAMHPTVKPAQMIADAIKDVSARGEIVLDLFGGSGSTVIAAHKTGRRAFVCEIDPTYCDRIIRRWQDCAKDDAEQIACGIVSEAQL